MREGEGPIISEGVFEFSSEGGTLVYRKERKEGRKAAGWEKAILERQDRDKEGGDTDHGSRFQQSIARAPHRISPDSVADTIESTRKALFHRGRSCVSQAGWFDSSL